MNDDISTDMVLNVLSLEDSVPDFEIIRGQLVNAGYALNISHVNNESEFESSLRSNTYDIILADFKLPGFDAFAALRLRNEICPDIPFICVSGTIGEETAIELIKQGAVDYVLKDRLERLPFAIKQALDEAQERETQRRTWEALHESERKLREAQEMAHLGFWRWDVTTGDVEWSEEVFKIFGLDPKTFTPRIDSILALSPWAEDHRRDKELINRAMKTHSPGNYEQRFLRPDQSIGYYYSTFQGNYNEKGDLISIIGTVLDITERKQGEELLHARMRLMEYAAKHSLNELLQMTLDEIGTLTNSPIGFYHFVEKDQKTLSLQAWSTRTLDTFCTAQGSGLHYSIDKAGVWVDCVHERRPIVHNDYASLSHRRGMPEGHAGVVRELVVPIMREDAIVAILGVGNKPSDYIEKDVQIVSYLADVAWEIAERKRAEELLNRSEEKYRGIFENSIEGIYQSTPEGRYLKVNPAFARMFGYDSPDEMIGQITDIEKQLYVNPSDREKLKKSLTDQGYVEGIDVEAYRKDGTTFWTSITARAVKDKTGATLYFEGMNMDITERKLADEELKRAHRDLEKNQMAMLNLLEDLNEENKTRKRTEEELRENEDKFRYVFESANVGKSITLPTGEITVNKALCKMIGYTQEELREKTWQDITHPDDIEDTQKMVDLLLNGDTDGTRFNKRYIHKNGSSVWADISSAIRRDREGKPLHLITTIVDITERMKYEDALRRSQFSIDNAVDQIFWVNRDGSFSYVNRSACEVLGYSVDELTLMKVWDIDIDFSPARWDEYFAQIRDEGFVKIESHQKKKDGSIFPVDISTNYARFQENEYVFAFARDITERKLAEEVLRDTEATQRALIEATKEALLLIDTNGIILLANETVTARMAGAGQDIVGTCMYDYFAPDVARSRKAHYDSVVATGNSVYFQDERLGRCYEIYCYPVMDDANNVTRLAIFANDITHRKEAERQRELTANILNSLNSPNDVAILTRKTLLLIKDFTGADALAIRVGKDEDYPYCEAEGFSEDFLTAENSLCVRGRNDEVVRDDAGRPIFECICGLVLSGKYNPESAFFTKGGSFWTNASSQLLLLNREDDPGVNQRNRCIHAGYESVALIPLKSGEEIIGLLQINDKQHGYFTQEMVRFLEEVAATIGIAVSRRVARDKLAESETRYRTIVDTASEGICIMDQSFTATFVNPRLAEMLGYSVEEVVGKPVDFFVVTEDLQDHVEKTEIRRKGGSSRYERRFRRKNGEILWTIISASPLMTQDGTFTGSYAMLTDITERKKAEEALKGYASRLESLRDLDLEILKVSAPEGIADIAVTHISKAINCTRASVIVFDIDHNIGTILAVCSRTVTKLVGGTVIPLDDLGFIPDISSGSPFAINDLYEEECPSVVRARLKTEGIRSILNIPLVVEGKLLGSLNLADEEPQGFSAEKQEIALEAARVLAIALQQSDLRKRIEKHLGELESEISGRAATEVKLRSTLEEREVLLREVHHRVKNNLQAMIFLMQMQREKVSDAPLADILHDLEGKARTMSLIYEQLFQSENLAHIDMEPYLTALIINNLQSLRERSGITPHISVSSVVMDVETAMPTGLIVNELITNVLKYAFPVSFIGKKELTVTLREEKEHYILTVSDNGIGLPAGTNPANTSTMGLKLVYLWVTHQLGGTITIKNNKGAAYIIVIPRKLSRSVPHA